MFRKLFLISRPISWPNTAYPFAAAFILSGGDIGPVFFVACVYFLAPYNLLMYGVNDVYDYESDILNPRKGGIEGMREQRAFHPTILRSVLITNIPFIIFLLCIGTLWANLILVIILFFVVSYSLVKLRFKEKPFLDSVTSSFHFVGPMVYGALLAHNGELPHIGIYILAFVLWGMASHAFGAVQDIIPDRKGNLASIATFLGAKWTVRFSFILYIGAALLILFKPFPISLIGLAGIIYAINVARYLNVSDSNSPESNKAWKRFIYLNLFTGFIVTLVCIYQFIHM